jgi:nicotinamidase-related amidase
MQVNFRKVFLSMFRMLTTHLYERASHLREQEQKNLSISQARKKELPRLKADETCLVIVDMQNDFVSSKGYFGRVIGQNLAPVQESVPRIANFLSYCREHNVPRVHVQVLHPDYTSALNWKGRIGDVDSSPKICIPGTWGAQIVPELKPQDGEPIITKRRYDAFLDTDLIVVLRTLRIKNVLLAGTKTNVCVETTARHSFCNDFTTVTLSDCVSTPDVGMQEASLWNLSTYFGHVATSEQVKRYLVFNDPSRELSAFEKLKI